MEKLGGWRRCAVSLASMTSAGIMLAGMTLAGITLAGITLPGMTGAAFAQVISRAPDVAVASTVAATKDPKDMSDAELTATIKRLDGELFGAYNSCELDKFGSFFPDHLEFYHDQTGGGPMTREQLVTAIRQNICGKVHRELVSSEVFRMKTFGALETGVHRFSHPGIDKEQGDARFVELWKYEGGRWWMTVVISYDHNVPVGRNEPVASSGKR